MADHLPPCPQVGMFTLGGCRCSVQHRSAFAMGMVATALGNKRQKPIMIPQDRDDEWQASGFALLP